MAQLHRKKSPKLPPILEGHFNIPTVRNLMCEYLAEVDLANKANRTTESDAMPPGDWIEVTPKMASRANKKKKDGVRVNAQ